MAFASTARVVGVALSTLAPLAAVAQAPGPRAGTHLGRLDRSALTYTAESRVVATGDINADPRYQTPVGTGFNGVASLELTTTAGLFICTGSLLNDGQTILTAGHCLTGATADPTFRTLSVTANFYPVNASPVRYTSTDFLVHPLYSGEVIDENDIALIRLAAPASNAIQRYDLFTGNAVGQDFTFAGYGRRGSAGLGSTLSAGFGLDYRRQGRNTFDNLAGDARWEGFWDDPAAATANVLLADFDNGTTGLASNDAQCVITGNFFLLFGLSQCDGGLGFDEANTAGGDSGGPGFINGQIASVTSFGLTFGQLARNFPFPDIDNALNSSFGEYSGFTSVSYHSQWINANLVPAAVPEPSTYVLVASGLAAMVGIARRRRA